MRPKHAFAIQWKPDLLYCAAFSSFTVIVPGRMASPQRCHVSLIFRRAQIPFTRCSMSVNAVPGSPSEAQQHILPCQELCGGAHGGFAPIVVDLDGTLVATDHCSRPLLNWPSAHR